MSINAGIIHQALFLSLGNNKTLVMYLQIYGKDRQHDIYVLREQVEFVHCLKKQAVLSWHQQLLRDG